MTESTETAASVAAFAPDLMDQSKIRSGLPEVTFVRRLDALADSDAAIVVVDLGRPGVLEVVGAIGGRVIGFGSHVDEDLLAAAADAGCDEVLARSVFFARIARGTLAAD